MKRIVQTTLLTGAAFSALAIIFALSPMTKPAFAKCESGQATDGNCANEAMTANASQSAMVFSQPKLSRTAHPVMPTADRQYRYPHQLIPDQAPTTLYRPAIIPPPIIIPSG